MLLRSADDLPAVKGASLAPNPVGKKRLNFRSLGHIPDTKEDQVQEHMDKIGLTTTYRCKKTTKS